MEEQLIIYDPFKELRKLAQEIEENEEEECVDPEMVKAFEWLRRGRK